MGACWAGAAGCEGADGVDRGDGVDGACGDGRLWRGIHAELHFGYHVSSDVDVDTG